MSEDKWIKKSKAALKEALSRIIRSLAGRRDVFSVFVLWRKAGGRKVRGNR